MIDSPASEDLLAEARYRRRRYDVYRATMYGPRPPTPTRLRELPARVLSQGRPQAASGVLTGPRPLLGPGPPVRHSPDPRPMTRATRARLASRKPQTPPRPPLTHPRGRWPCPNEPRPTPTAVRFQPRWVLRKPRIGLHQPPLRFRPGPRRHRRHQRRRLGIPLSRCVARSLQRSPTSPDLRWGGRRPISPRRPNRPRR